MRLLFGGFWLVDAALKWQPGFRRDYLEDLRDAAAGQPHWLHGWFSTWIDATQRHATLAAVLVAVIETVLALSVLTGTARWLVWPLGAVFSLGLWSVGEGFGGPYNASSTDIGTAVVYALVFAALLALLPRGSQDPLSLDRVLTGRVPGWRRLADAPHQTPANPTGAATVTATR